MIQETPMYQKQTKNAASFCLARQSHGKPPRNFWRWRVAMGERSRRSAKVLHWFLKSRHQHSRCGGTKKRKGKKKKEEKEQ